MNEPSPLVPQGSFESQARRKSHVKIAVFSILAVHVVVLGGLLILGCKREDKGTGADTAGVPPMTNDMTPPPFGADVVTTGAPASTAPPATTTPGATVGTPPPATTTPPVTTPPQVVTDAGPMTEHKIARGESFSSLSVKYGVTLKAIQDANPNLVPTRLQIGDVVKIPPKTATPVRAAVADDPDVYTVKSGDTLGKIADSHKTTVRELQRLNDLKTTQIKVGDKLKLPPRAAGAPGSGTVPPAQ